MITSFILSQVGEQQNELVFSSNSLDKQELSNCLYSISGKLLDKSSFYRCFRMRRKIVMAHYWKTTYSEIKSGRSGLFVIVGFIIDDALLPNYDSIIGHCKQFLCELQEVFSFSFSNPFSDSLFSQLQGDTGDKMEQLKTRFTNAVIPEPSLFFGKIWRKRHPTLVHIPQAIYCLHEVDGLTNWTIFFYESLRYIRQGCWDISSHTNTSPVSIQILNRKDPFPANSAKAIFKRYQQCLYLLAF